MAQKYTCPILLGGSLALFIWGARKKERLAEVSIFPKEEFDFCFQFFPIKPMELYTCAHLSPCGTHVCPDGFKKHACEVTIHYTPNHVQNGQFFNFDFGGRKLYREHSPALQGNTCVEPP